MLPTFDTLSPEILTEICEVIHDTSRHTIFSLLQVNKTIYDVALPFVYREMAFDHDQVHRDGKKPTEKPYTRALEQLDSFFKLPSEHVIWKGVREIAVYASLVVWPGEPEDSDLDSDSINDETPFPGPYVPSEQEVRDRWDMFISFLSRVTGLRKLVFDCTERVPFVLLHQLETKHPSCHLHVRNWTRISCATKFGDPYEEALARSPCLRGIEVELSNAYSLRIHLEEAAFERILALSPNLEEFTVSFGTFHGIDNEEKEKEVKRFQMAVPVRKTSVRTIRWHTVSGHLFATHCRRWSTFIDLRNVETLEVGGPPDTEWMEYAIVHSAFQGLRHLKLIIAAVPLDASSRGRYQSTLESFLLSLPPLQSLSVISFHGYINLPSILRRHGQSLRSLSLHEVECRDRQRPSLSCEDLKLILSESLLLEHLAIDLNRSRSPTTSSEMTVAQAYKVLASFQRLLSITIHFNLGLHDENVQFYAKRFRRPSLYANSGVFKQASDAADFYTKVDKEFVKEVWCAVKNQRLENMTLDMGTLSQGLRYGTRWQQSVKKHIRVSRNERDDLRDDVDTLQIIGLAETE
ncbi:hypothetical protein PQX77_019004 [Marasmius sp. AFHP31]|nr:hypothetical protein PQX77_019004 [Marasmius sp. AFHP31]